jgi:hypothetical protein
MFNDASVSRTRVLETSKINGRRRRSIVEAMDCRKELRLDQLQSPPGSHFQRYASIVIAFVGNDLHYAVTSRSNPSAPPQHVFIAVEAIEWQGWRGRQAPTVHFVGPGAILQSR